MRIERALDRDGVFLGTSRHWCSSAGCGGAGGGECAPQREEVLAEHIGTQAPSGSLTDVPGKGVHDGENWALEMGRKFVTGNPDDRELDPTRPMQCAIAVLNDELYWAHSVSQELLLQFEPAGPR